MHKQPQTDIYTFKQDVGKNLYRKKTYYTLVVEQDVLAKDKDEADQKFLDFGGINHSKIGKDMTDTSDGVETYMVDANYTDSDTTKYLGKVTWDTDTYNQTLEEAKEAEDIHIDTYADEVEVMTPEEEDKNAGVVRDSDGNVVSEATFTDKELSDIDTSLNLEMESNIGK